MKKKMRNIYKNCMKVVLATALLLFSSCDFNDINIDPNNPVSVPTSHLMTSAQRSVAELIFGNSNVIGLASSATTFIQHWAGTRGGGNDIYTTVELDFSNFYTGPLADLNEVIRLNSNEATALEASQSGVNGNQIAIARILKVYIFHNITDIWGKFHTKNLCSAKRWHCQNMICSRKFILIY